MFSEIFKPSEWERGNIYIYRDVINAYISCANALIWIDFGNDWYFMLSLLIHDSAALKWF